MDWSKELVLNFFLDFVLGKIDEIENMLKLVKLHNHSETPLNKIC